MWVRARCKPLKHGFIFLRRKMVLIPVGWEGLVPWEVLRDAPFLEPAPIPAEAVPAEEHTDDLPIIILDDQ